MTQDNIQSTSSISSDVEQMPYESVAPARCAIVVLLEIA
jgi:hypothetical protein